MTRRIQSFWVFLALGIVYAIGAATRAGVPGMVFTEIQATLGWTASQTALISSLGVVGCMVFLPLGGWAIDCWGWYFPAWLSVILQVVGAEGMATDSMLLIYGGAFLNGAGRTLIYLAIFKLLDVEFARRYFSLWIGLFYLLSYGGTWCGSWAFGGSVAWQDLLQIGNRLILGVALCLGFLSMRYKQGVQIKAPAATTESSEPRGRFFSRESVMAVSVTAFGILVYWTFLTVGAKPYLNAFYQGEVAPLLCMNTLVVIGMVGGGPLSFGLGNQRRVFQWIGFSGVILALGSLALGWVWLGFILLGVGYGMTAIQMCALRESVPSAYSARAIALTNFIANIGIILFSQIIGYFYDCCAL